MKNLNPHQEDMKIFFRYIMIYSFVALLTTNYDGKTRQEILNSLFLREISGLIIGVFGSVGTLIGKAWYFHLRKKFTKNEKHDA